MGPPDCRLDALAATRASELRLAELDFAIAASVRAAARAPREWGGDVYRVRDELLPVDLTDALPPLVLRDEFAAESPRGAIRERLNLLLMAQTPKIPRDIIADGLNKLFANENLETRGRALTRADGGDC